MSIKTTKRIALGVIASLVFAPFAAIAPASAANAVGDTFVSMTATLDTATTTYAGRVGQEVSITVTGSAAAVTSADTTMPALSIAATITSQPGTTVYPTLDSVTSALGTELDFVNAGLVFDTNATAIATGVSSTGTASSVATLNYSVGTEDEDTSAIAAGTTLATLRFTPNAVGTYTVVVWNERDRTIAAVAGAADNAVNAATQAALSGSESFQTFTINVSSAVSAITMTATNTTAVKDAAGTGSLIKVALTDAAGNIAIPATGQAVTLTPTGSALIKEVNGSNVTSAAGAAYALSAAAFGNTGEAWINVTNGTAETVSLTATMSGASSANVSLTFRTVGDPATDIAPTPSGTSGFTAAAGVAANGTSSWPIGAVTASFYLTGTYSATTASYLGVTVTDTTGDITGVAGLQYSPACTVGDDAVGPAASLVDGCTFAVSFSTLAATANIFTVVAVDGTDPRTQTVTTIATSAGTLTATPATAVFAAPSSTVTIRVNLKDNFSRNYANQTISAAVTGRNPALAVSKATDASGNAEFTFVDANPTSLTTSSLVTFTGGTGTTVTINYNASYVPTTITLGGGNNSATGVALASPQYKDIDAGVDGAQGGVQTISATLKDANGSVLSGVPVTWTVSDAGTKANILSTTATTYTNASGVASTSVYAWINGTYTVTATAGAVSATVTIDFLQATAAEARTISAAASGSVVTATVKDRFGNPVPGVTVWASAPGAAYFGTGTKVANVNTDSAGNAVFVVAGADATITVTTYDPGLTATNGNGLKGSGQTCAAVDKVNCAATATSFTEFTAGTTSVAEEGVGASLAAAGVSSATAAVTGLTPAEVVAPAEKPTLEVVKSGGRIYLSGTAADGEGDIIIYVKRVGTSAWKERAKTLEVAAPGDFNGSIKAPKNNVVIRVKQEGTGLFSNQVIALR